MDEQTNQLNELALFTGTGGGLLASKLLGWQTVCAVEYEKHARDLLIARQDDGCLEPFPIWDDVRTFDGKPWRGLVDVISGGFPCQDISSGNARAKGIAGERSGLWTEMARIVSEVQPGWVFIENSPMLVGRGLAVVLCDLAKMGYDAVWGIVGAGDIGFPHLRKRCWIYAYNPKNADPRFRRSHNGGESHGESEWIRPKSGEDWKCWLSDLAAMDVVARVSTYTEGRGVLHGIPNGMDRLARLGNAQVPAVACEAWKILEQLYTER